jgi:hypothetical protein
MRYITLYMSLLLTFCTGLVSAADVQSFKLAMQNELTKAQDNVQQLERRISDRSYAPQTSDKIALQNAIIMLDVKTIIVNKFSTGTAINDLNVQETILAILRKDMITAGDLEGLQAAVNEAHRKEAEQPQSQPQAQQPKQLTM